MRTPICMGMFGGYCEVDVNEIVRLQELFDRKKTPDLIDLDAVVANFDGHTIFSLFDNEERLTEQIHEQLRESEFEPEIQDDETEIQHHMLRRIFRILNMPTPETMDEQEREELDAQEKKLAKE